MAGLGEIDVVILCGGLGTRLSPVVSDRPKALAKIGETVFLDILMRNLGRQGFRNMILCVGHLRDQIKTHLNQNGKGAGRNIMFSEEEEPLGTGGALKKANPLIKSDSFMVLNGDSICKINFSDFYGFHTSKGGILSMALVRSRIVMGSGTVTVDGSQRITSFREKVADGGNGCLVNAGIYFMQRDVFSHMPDKNKFSLEYDLFPKLVKDEEKCYGFIMSGDFIDIGTPEGYKTANNNHRQTMGD